MIGLYAQNKNTTDQLVNMLADLLVEVYRPNTSYSTLIWLSNQPAPTHTNLLTPNLGELPWTRGQWRLFVQKHLIETSRYENSSFVFDPTQRLLTNLATQVAISLTEKETAFLAFLVRAKDHKATKEEILESVWQYSPEAETHTVESHLYGLKQKLGTSADKLIRVQDGVFYLI